jgi:hypothetical protein
MATDTDDSRLGRLEGQVAQQSIAIQELSRRLDTGFAEIRARIDWLFLATWAIGGGIIAALVVQIVRAG